MRQRQGFIAATLGTCALLLVVLPGGCGGGGVSGDGGGSPAANTPRFAYVLNTDNTVSMYTVDAAGGQLRHRGYIAAGTGPSGLAVDPSSKFVYAANFTSNDLSAYAINTNTGTLTAVAGSPFAAGTGTVSVTATGTIQ